MFVEISKTFKNRCFLQWFGGPEGVKLVATWCSWGACWLQDRPKMQKRFHRDSPQLPRKEPFWKPVRSMLPSEGDQSLKINYVVRVCLQDFYVEELFDHFGNVAKAIKISSQVSPWYCLGLENFLTNHPIDCNEGDQNSKPL